LLKVSRKEPPVELVHVPKPGYALEAADEVDEPETGEPEPEGDEPEPEGDEPAAEWWVDHQDGMVSLPGGAWLLIAKGVLWHWVPGQAPRQLALSLKDSTFDACGSAWRPEDLAMFAVATSDGKVAVADCRRVYRIDLGTGRATPVVGPDTANLAGKTVDASLLSITGLAVAPNGDLLITDGGARQVKRVPAAAW
jgi:hypothetical protein